MTQWEKQVQQSLLKEEQRVLRVLRQAYDAVLRDVNDRIGGFTARIQADANDTAAIYQLRYQQALQQQVEAVTKDLQDKNYQTIQSYLDGCYTSGYVGAMYSIHKQGIPLILPIQQENVMRAITLDSKISVPMYTRLDNDIQLLKAVIAAETTRGIASGSSWHQIASQIAAKGRISYFNAVRIARTEGHRIQCEAQMDACQNAREHGADVVKQWDSTMDSRTRPHHQKLHGQVRELDDLFEVDGLRAMQPGGFGNPAEDCNCRCCLLQRARWDLDKEELRHLQELEEVKALEQAEGFEEFRGKYLELATSPSDQAQLFKPVVLDIEDVLTLQRGMLPISFSRSVNSKNAVYISNTIKIKPKQLHNIDRMFTEVFRKLGISKSTNLPQICVVSNAEMQSNAIAAYNPVKNVLYVDQITGIKSELIKLQTTLACSNNELSTYLHEMIHWQDAEAYRRKYGEITDFFVYMDYLNQKHKKALDKLSERGYNIFSISDYASDEYRQKQYAETYTEYRVKEMLER